MRVLWEMFDDEIAYTKNDEFDDTIEILEVTTDIQRGPVRIMSAEVKNVEDIILENRMTHQLWYPMDVEYQGDNTYMITDFEAGEVADED